MGTGRTDEFRKDAVRIARTSGLSRRQIADDLGVGVSTLNPWVNAHRDTDVVSAEDRELARRITAWARDPHPQGFEPDPRNSLGDCFPGERGDPGKKPPSSSRAKSGEVQVRRRAAWGLPDRPAVPGDECQPSRAAGLSQPPGQSLAAHGQGCSGPLSRNSRV